MFRSFSKILVMAMCLSISSCALFQPSKIGRGAAQDIVKAVDKLSDEEIVYKLTQTAVEGAIAGLASTDSDDELAKFGEVLAETLGEKLNAVFDNLDTRTPGSKFAKGVTDSLINKKVEADIKLFIDGVIDKTGGDLNQEIALLTDNINRSIASIIPNLNREISSLDESVERVLSNQLKDSLSNFLSEAISGIELKDFSNKISTDLLSGQLRDTLKAMASEIRDELDVTENVPSFMELVKKNAYEFLGLAFLLIAGLIYFRHMLKQRRDYEEDVASVLSQMMDDNPSIKDKVETMLKEKNRLDDFKTNVNRKKET